MRQIELFLKSTEKIFAKNSFFWGVVGLLFGGIFVGRLWFQAHFDYLFMWDEQFHALVAKNMAEGSFWEPILQKEHPLKYNYKDWSSNYYWLHKQPFFLWQMALFIKVLGTDPWVIRLPSLLMNLGTALLFIDMGRILFNSRWLGFWAGLLLLLNPYSIIVTTGMEPTDHNDAAFLFYLNLSLWAFLHYWQKKTWKWVLLIAVAVAAAALTKWIIGFWIFGVWGLTLLHKMNHLKNTKNWLHIFIGFICSLILFLPWQLYASQKFPLEYFYEMEYNSRHLYEALEGHARHTFFYWETFSRSFGGFPYMKFFVPFGVVLWFFKQSKPRALHMPLTVGFILFLAVFSYSATKMSGYVYPMSFFIYAFTVYIIFVMIWWFKNLTQSHIFSVFALSFLIYGSSRHLDFNRLKMKTILEHTDNGNHQRKKIADLARSVAEEKLVGKYAFFNLPTHEAIHFQYYTHHVAYAFMPDFNIMDEMKRQGYKSICYYNSANKEEVLKLSHYFEEIRELEL